MHRRQWRGERGGVVHDLGQRMHDALGRMPGDGDLAAVVQPDTAVGADPAHRAAQNALHRDRLVPPPPGPGPGQHGDTVGQPSRLRRRVVQLHQIAEHFLAVPVLHLAQIREHSGGERLHPACGVGAGGHRRGPHPLTAPDLLGQRPQNPPMRPGHGAGRAAERGVDRGPVPQLDDQRGQGLIGQPLGLGLQVPDARPVVECQPPLEDRGGQRGAERHRPAPAAPGEQHPYRRRREHHRPSAQSPGHHQRGRQGAQRRSERRALCLTAGGYPC